VPSLRANGNGWEFIAAGPCDLERRPCGLGAWLQMARAQGIAPVLALARLARERGVAVLFLSGRPERLRAATERNLRAAGYEWTGILLKLDALATASAVDLRALEWKSSSTRATRSSSTSGTKRAISRAATPSGRKCRLACYGHRSSLSWRSLSAGGHRSGSCELAHLTRRLISSRTPARVSLRGTAGGRRPAGFLGG
jgi:hypothetical protein